MGTDRGEKALRRAVYTEYAKASACAEAGGELWGEALRRGREALALWARLAAPTSEDRLLRREIAALLERLGERP